MAVNKARDKQGIVKPGMTCSRVGSPEAHKGFPAHKALACGEATFVHMPPRAGMVWGSGFSWKVTRKTPAFLRRADDGLQDRREDRV